MIAGPPPLPPPASRRSHRAAALMPYGQREEWGWLRFPPNCRWYDRASARHHAGTGRAIAWPLRSSHLATTGLPALAGAVARVAFPCPLPAHPCPVNRWGALAPLRRAQGGEGSVVHSSPPPIPPSPRPPRLNGDRVVGVYRRRLRSLAGGGSPPPTPGSPPPPRRVASAPTRVGAMGRGPGRGWSCGSRW